VDSYWNNQTGNSLSLTVNIESSVAFGAHTNRTSNSTWYVNGSTIETDLSTQQTNFTYTFNSVGTYNVNVSATDGIDTTANTSFVVTVIPTAIYYNISGYVFSNGIAVENATISNNQTAKTVVSNTSGYYILSLENGSVLITASKEGYLSNTTIVNVNGSDLYNQNITLDLIEITNEEIYQLLLAIQEELVVDETAPTEIIKMTYQIFIILIIIDLLAVWYSFTHMDRSYYTDIITSLLSVIISGIISYNSIIGVSYFVATQSTVHEIMYTSASLSILFAGVMVIMMIFFITKILELTHKELDYI
ncbi:MAG: carboxypeptidase regulatory-like domain-containing protein, partial [Methanosarcinaceae archaeon]|nr:carboxypeptidase regulatory-like domain-containing protein [Methanosarcinaceae archaeon]